jgi:hypothetical protein
MNPPGMLDQAALPWFSELNKSLNDELDDAAFHERIRFSTRQMRALAGEISARARARDDVDTATLERLLAAGSGHDRPGSDATGAAMLFAAAA